jgi:hypothetical protein
VGGFGRNPTTGRTLNPIVTDRSGGIKGVGDFGAAGLALIVGGVAPHSGEAVRLQLKADGERPSLTRMRLLQGPHVPFGAQQILDMVAVFVGNHIGLREVSVRRRQGKELIRLDSFLYGSLFGLWMAIWTIPPRGHRAESGHHAPPILTFFRATLALRKGANDPARWNTIHCELGRLRRCLFRRRQQGRRRGWGSHAVF